MYRLFGEDGEERLSRNDAAHGMAYEYRAHRRVNCGRRGRVGDLEVYDLVLQPFFEATDTLV